MTAYLIVALAIVGVWWFASCIGALWAVAEEHESFGVWIINMIVMTLAIIGLCMGLT